MSDLSSDASGGTPAPAASMLQFRHLLDTLPAAAYTCDVHGLIDYFNQHAVTVWGRAPQLNDPIDRFCGSFKLFAADGTPIDHAECWMALALRNDKAYIGEEIIVQRPDGQRVNVLAHATPLHDDAGRLIGAVNVLVDVGDRNRAAEAQTLLAAIVESSDDAIISKSLEGRILSWNGGAERLFGYTAAEAIGSPITLIIPPESRDEERTILARLRRGERIEHYETVRVSKEGRHINISLTISPIRDTANRIIAASKVARDITPRKQSEESLTALHKQLATELEDLSRLRGMSLRLSTTLELRPILEETLRTAAAIGGTDLGLLSLCDAEQRELTVGASLGFDESFLKLIQPMPHGGACGMCFEQRQRVIIEDVETDPRFADHVATARQAGFRAVHSTPLITRSGKMVGVLSLHFRHPHRPGDREQHLMDLCARQAVDFIENARLYTQLRMADQRKEEFLATLAHELRNPLSPICNSLHLLRLSADIGPADHTVLDIMDRQVGHLVRLVDDLLEVSRITRGKIELRRETISLAAVVRTAVETSQSMINAAGHQLAITLPPEPLLLDADPVRLAQVLSNLLNNAAKYTAEGGPIWLHVRSENGQAVISVRDTGIGIPATMLPRVFDMFTQADQALSRSHGGLGIGLTLARNLVELHGGRIEAKSEGAGEGSEFIVHLPLAAESGVVSEMPAVDLPISESLRPARRILVVDDSQAGLFVLGRLLETMGHQVRTA
ncbi:MAG: MEKHLA domain-containing protein, partial [Planctomycetia bacterium]|nr:MEKHLA domain-containing protein [Planctomycetia bacterium]